MRNIYFATNRNPIHSEQNNISDETIIDFGKHFSTINPGNLRFGYLSIYDDSVIPKPNIFPDTEDMGSKMLMKEFQDTMKQDNRDTLIFIHGFNVEFKAAIKSANDMARCYKAASERAFEPNIFVFSWPSDGSLIKFKNDRHDAEASGYAFARGLMKLADFLSSTTEDNACRQKIHLIAHSMGNYVLRHALQQAPKLKDSIPMRRLFDNIILTAADEDNDAFEHEHKLARLPDLAQRITVYFNNGDLALKTSESLKGNPDRLGHDGPNHPRDIQAKVVLVDVGDVIDDSLGHSYHENNTTVARDIVQVLMGQRSERIEGRVYVPHANKFILKK